MKYGLGKGLSCPDSDQHLDTVCGIEKITTLAIVLLGATSDKDRTHLFALVT